MSGQLINDVEAPIQDNGEFVRLVWLIEAARDGQSCTMDELISHARKFFTIENIKFRDPEFLAAELLSHHLDKIKVKSS